MNQGHLTIELSEEQSDALREWAEQLSWDSGMERPAHISVSFTTSPSGKIVLKFTVDIQLLVEQLHALDQGVRENAIDRLQYLRDFCDTPITDEVAPLLDDTKPYTRAAAISALNDSSTRAEAEVLEKVIGLLGDDEERVKEEAIEFVESQMGSIGATALWRVLLMLRSEKTSGCAQRILDEIGRASCRERV